MADFEFYVDIEDSSGNKLGGGPLASVQRWRYTARFDRAGSIDFPFAANDPQAAIVQNRRIARARALLNGVWTEVGAGVIDTVETIPGNDGRVSLVASGMDLIRELGYRTVGNLEIGAGSGATHSAALTAISALAPVGWTFTPAVSPDNDYIYARYGGESVLGALVYLAERTQTHFYRSENRTLVFTSEFESSGIRAIQAYGNLAAETCAITSLRRTVDTHDLLTRITPYGSGQGNARLTLAATSRVAPVGYTLNAADNYIENDAATVAYGLVDFPEIEFKEITPISNTDADLEAAADMLFDAALEELRRRSTLAEQVTYTLQVEGCSQLLRPMQTIRVVYRDVDQGIDIDDDLYILEATWEVDESGVRTTDLVVSTDDRWPVSDVIAAAERAVEGRVFQAHPQLNANSYVTAYTKNVDENEIAEFRFRFGLEVVNLQRVLFEFQILPFESTVRSIASDSPSTSAGGFLGTSTFAGGGETVSTASGGNQVPTTSTGGSDIVTSSSGGSSTPTTASGGSATPTSSSAGSQTPTTSTVVLGSTDFGNGASPILTGVGSTDTFSYAAGDTIQSSGVMNSIGGWDDAHWHATDIGTHHHRFDFPSHTHVLLSTSHTHTVSISAHTHTVTISAHTHTVTISAHTHTISIAAHSHTVTIPSHTHSVTTTSHTHSITIPSHTHTVSPVITTEYGIFREDPLNTYALADLEYQVNSGGWSAVDDDAVDAGDGWWQLDITMLVMSAVTFRPIQANNLLQIRSLVADKTATIDAQLSVRNTIQAIAYT